MKRLAAVAAVICSLITACNEKDTGPAAKWPRAIEPRLSGGSPATLAPVSCNDVVLTLPRAQQLLITQPGCTSAAIKALQGIALTHPEAYNDLAAALYVRARREDRPVDLLEALDKVDEAPRSAEALFNRALIQEALGLRDAAMASWREFLKEDRSDWAAEARQHLSALEQRVDGAAQWERNKALLATTHDPAAIAQLIAPFPSSAVRWLEEHPVPEVASELSHRADDRYPTDLLSHWSQLAAAREAAARGRQAMSSLIPAQAIPQYRQAIRLLERNESPLALTARLELAGLSSFDSYESQLSVLADIEHKATVRGYRRLAARTRATRANSLYRTGLFVPSLLAYDEALAQYRQIGDDEDAGTTIIRRAGVFREAGASRRAWRDVMEALALSQHLTTIKDRHNLLGEAASTALSLGHPETALLYQNAAIAVIPKDQERQMAAALRHRAAIQLMLGRDKLAEEDVNRASKTPAEHRILRLPLEEIRGRTMLKTNPLAAADALTHALELASPGFPTPRAVLYVERSEAYRRAGRSAEARQDLVEASKEIAKEQTQNLERRKSGQSEDLWSAYFSRFQNVYHGLIRGYLDQGDGKSALAYAEEARGIEPLRLTQDTPPPPFDIEALQKVLPPGTYMLEYAVLEDRTIVWIISNDYFETMQLAPARKNVEAWSADVQSGTVTDFTAALDAAYDGLIEKPLEKIKGKATRLVFVPDGAMHGLPFGALHDSRAGVYVIEHMPVEIIGSARLYLAALKSDAELQSSSDRSLLLVGNPTGDLPRAEPEVRSIASQYGRNTKMLLGPDATPRNFLAAVPGKTVIHIAAHSVFDDEAPFRSYILLAPATKLYAHDLLTSVHADRARLVVLSSCRSAGGGPVGAEGVAPLVRPLIASHVPAVVGSLWNVIDATAEELLVSFHQHYREGQDAATALRSAQIEMLRKNPNVKAWGAFQVIGHGSSPFPPAPPPKEKPP